jgi:hypothetical protein
MAWYADVPAVGRWTLLGVIPLIGILGVYYSNTKWMVQMCRKRPPKVKTPKAGDKKAANGFTTNGNGHSNGHSKHSKHNGHSNGDSNGHTNGDTHSNSNGNGHVKSS